MIEELVNFVSAASEEEDAAEYIEGFDPDIEEKEDYTTQDLFSLVTQLVEHLDIEGDIILHLEPASGRESKKWVKWVQSAIAIIPERIRLILTQSDENPMYNLMAQRAEGEIMLLRPEADIPQAIAQLSAQGKADEPDTRFRAYYVGMNQAAEKGEIDEMELLGEKAIGVTERYKWPLMAAAVHLLRGGVYVNLKKKKKGDKAYDQAIDILEAAVDEKVDMARDQLVIALFSKGMVKMLQKEYAFASDVYQLAGEHANLTENRYLTMDAWRMCGHCLVKIKENDKAIECHQKAIAAAEGLEQEVLRGSTLPYAAAELITLLEGGEKIEIDDRMKELIGDDWESLLEEGKKKKK